MPASPEPPVPDWSFALAEDPLAIPPGPFALSRDAGSPLGPRAAGADVAPPRSEAGPEGFCSQAPKARAPITATAPMMSLFDMVLSRSMASASKG
jgi:hypothetical protein